MKKLKVRKAALKNAAAVKKVAREMAGTPLKENITTGAAKSEVKKTVVNRKRDNRANLGAYLYKSKLPNTGTKIGASNVRVTTKKKLLKTRAQKGVHLNV